MGAREYFVKVVAKDLEPQTFFVGPYSDHEEAQSSIDEAISGQSPLANADEVDIYPKFTAIREHGMKEKGKKANVLSNMPYTFEDLKALKHVGSEKRNVYEEEEERGVERVAPIMRETREVVATRPVRRTETFIPKHERETVIITRSMELIAFLADMGIKGEIISYVGHPSQVAGKRVIGILPYHLASQAYEIGILHIPRATREQREREMTAKELKEAGTTLDWYVPPRKKENIEE